MIHCKQRRADIIREIKKIRAKNLIKLDNVPSKDCALFCKNVDSKSILRLSIAEI